MATTGEQTKKDALRIKRAKLQGFSCDSNVVQPVSLTAAGRHRRAETKLEVCDSPLEQSKPPQPGSHWQVSGETQRPWSHSSVQSAEDREEKTN